MAVHIREIDYMKPYVRISDMTKGKQGNKNRTTRSGRNHKKGRSQNQNIPNDIRQASKHPRNQNSNTGEVPVERHTHLDSQIEKGTIQIDDPPVMTKVHDRDSGKSNVSQLHTTRSTQGKIIGEGETAVEEYHVQATTKIQPEPNNVKVKKEDNVQTQTTEESLVENDVKCESQVDLTRKVNMLLFSVQPNGDRIQKAELEVPLKVGSHSLCRLPRVQPEGEEDATKKSCDLAYGVNLEITEDDFKDGEDDAMAYAIIRFNNRYANNPITAKYHIEVDASKSHVATAL